MNEKAIGTKQHQVSQGWHMEQTRNIPVRHWIRIRKKGSESFFPFTEGLQAPPLTKVAPRHAASTPRCPAELEQSVPPAAKSLHLADVALCTPCCNKRGFSIARMGR